MRNTGYTSRTIHQALEESGAVGIISSYWSKGFGLAKFLVHGQKNSNSRYRNGRLFHGISFSG